MDQKKTEKLNKKQAWDVIKLCFAETNEKYLSYADFKFLLHPKSQIGTTIPKEKKELYKKWEKQFHFNSDTIQYPFKRFYFTSGRFTAEIANSLIKEGKLKKTVRKGKPVYFLPIKQDLYDIIRIRHKAVIDNTLPDEIWGGELVACYGIPKTLWNLPGDDKDKYRINKKLHRIENQLIKNSEKFADVIAEIAAIKLQEIFKKIEKGNFKNKDKKIAYMFIDKIFGIEIDLSKLFDMGIIETSQFKWVGDGTSLEYIIKEGKKYNLNEELSKLLYEFQKKELYWHKKYSLIVLKPYPNDNTHYKFAKAVCPILEKIKNELKLNK